MLDGVPAQVWLLLLIATVAIAPAAYVIRYVQASPANRDIARPPDDLSWRSRGRLVLNLAALAALVGLAIFIWTPAAEELARSPRFLPAMLAVFGSVAAVSVGRSLLRGHVTPMIKGVTSSFARAERPVAFWLSITWNAILGIMTVVGAWSLNMDASKTESEDRCFRQSPDHRGAISACDKLIADAEPSEHGLPDLLIARGDAYAQEGDYRRANADYSAAIDGLNRQIADRQADAGAYKNRGVLLLNRGSLGAALEDLNRAHQLAPDDAWTLANRGLTYAWLGRREAAVADLRAARKLDPDNLVAVRGEAVVAMGDGDHLVAVQRLSEALKQAPDDPWSIEMRARSYEALDEIELARADWDRLRGKGRFDRFQGR